MKDLTFGEQVKILLSRKGMTIKELAEGDEVKRVQGRLCTMSRQNLTQRAWKRQFPGAGYAYDCSQFSAVRFV